MPETYSSKFEDTLREVTAVPPASPEFVNSLWERIHEQSTRKFPAAKNRNQSSYRSIWASSVGPVPHRTTLRPLFLVGLIVLVIAGVFFVTPAGRVVAEQVVAFFTHADRNEKTIPLQSTWTAQTPVFIPTATIVNPTQIFSFGGSKSTEQVDPSVNNSQFEYTLKEPQDLPRGYKFSYARYDPKNRNTQFVYAYTAQAKGEMIMLTLSPTLIQDEVGPNAQVEKIQVNGRDGNVVRGGWMVLAGETHETWEPRVPVTTLRWFDGEIYIKLQFHLNEPFSPAYLDFSQMLKVAESIKAVDPGKTPSFPSAGSRDIRNMEEQVGFSLLEPGMLPAGYQLEEVLQVPGRQQVDARYRPATSDESGPRLSISQIPLSGLPEIKPQNYPPDLVELVDISGKQGRLMMGVNDGSGSYPSWWLFWETPDLAMSIWYYPGPNLSPEAAKAIMVEVAKSMK